MARERSYRHDVRCRRCGSKWMLKDGHMRSQQVRKCDACKKWYMADAKWSHFPGHIKRLGCAGVHRGREHICDCANSRHSRCISEWLDQKGGGCRMRSDMRVMVTRRR